MNATIKFAVVLVIGVVCAIVTARPVEEISKDTKLGISSSTNKATTIGIGAELGEVTASTGSSSFGSGFVDAASPPNRATSSGSGSSGASGFVIASGPRAAANSQSGSNANGGARAAAGPGVASSDGSGNGNSGSGASGTTSG